MLAPLLFASTLPGSNVSRPLLSRCDGGDINGAHWELVCGEFILSRLTHEQLTMNHDAGVERGIQKPACEGATASDLNSCS